VKSRLRAQPRRQAATARPRHRPARQGSRRLSGCKLRGAFLRPLPSPDHRRRGRLLGVCRVSAIGPGLRGCVGPLKPCFCVLKSPFLHSAGSCCPGPAPALSRPFAMPHLAAGGGGAGNSSS
jgi:hypothetical protein